MKYKFETQKLDIDKSPYYFINIETNKYKIITRFSDSNWTPTLAQEIIDGVEGSRNKSFSDAYTWGNEDVILKSMEHGVFLWDMIARRANKNHQTEQDLLLTHDEFIAFMTDFKKFIEANQ